VTIAYSGLPPAMEELSMHFAGRACSGILDLYVGYDERVLAERSRDLVTVTNFIWPYLHQFFNNSHGLNGTQKPLKRPFDQY